MTKSVFFVATTALLFLYRITICSAEVDFNLTTDQNALVAFKNSITLDPYQVLAKNWSSDASVCSWIGVSCDTDARNQRVTSLNFSGFSLGAILAPNLGNLTFLSSLDLGLNNFTDSIPPELSNLRRLEVIYLDSNEFTGEIPSWFGTLPRLEVLFLGRNKFSGSIPTSLFNNSKLRMLGMAYNFLDGNIPLEIGNISSLETFDLKYNAITGVIPHGIFNMSSLASIDLTGNSLSGSLPPDMCDNMLKLKRLHLSSNLLHGEIPYNIYKCEELQVLSLSFNHFSGSITSSIGSLTKLQNLYLGINDFQAGEIPSELGNLTRLELLSMRGASLSGKIPSFIFNMSSMTSLDLANNSLSGSLPVDMYFNLPNLEVLSLYSNNLTGRIFHHLWGCKRLSFLSLSLNSFTGEIPRGVGNLTGLQSLFLPYNNFKGGLPSELANLNLVKLNVAFNELSGSIPSSMFNISTLEMMSLNNNSFSGRLPSTMGLWLPSLEEIYLSNNRFSGVIPSSISNASNLNNLDVGTNSFSGPIPDFSNLKLLRRLLMGENNLTGEHYNQEMRFLSSLTNCRQLESVEVSLNQLDGILPASIGNFSDSLQVFRAFGCRIKGSIPQEMGNLTSLRDLYLDSNELTGFIPRTLGKLTGLVRVYLEYNKLGGYIPSDLCQLRNLGDLYLSNNMLIGPIPECVGELKSLRRLYLDSNKFESRVPFNLWNLNDLSALNLSTNILNGSLPPAVGNLKVIRELDLSWNQFSGEIPSNIGDQESLSFLSLAQNILEGSIPGSIGNLKGLESLDLSFNNLSGFIPISLAELKFLRYFNVSYNRLEGPIPTGGNFANFTAQSFLKNSGLCGETRLQVPTCQGKTRSNNTVKLLKYVIPPCILAILIVALIVILIRRRKSNRGTPECESALIDSWGGISYQELVQATDDFHESKLLGSGSFGSVFRGVLSDGSVIAVKVFSLHSDRIAKSFKTEGEVLSKIRHRNLVKIIGCCSYRDFKALVLEYMHGGSLDDWLYSQKFCSLDLLQRLNIAMDVVSALEYLHLGHTSVIIHCDLKPSNILLDDDMTAHISDFGIAKLFDQGELMAQTKTLATIGYMAPEYGTQGIVSTSGDVYSFGIVLLETFTRKKPTDEMFNEETSLKDWVNISLQKNTILEVVDISLLKPEDQDFSAREQCVSSVLGLAMSCLAISPSARIGIREVSTRLEQIRTVFLATSAYKSTDRKKRSLQDMGRRRKLGERSNMHEED
ncbi:uncharacterized protein [Primulina eburnea]|uniref:uncharacterized protein isoform X1 n=2 Tax=Primulina eburnea TaxID=1245227 RepID=UPI003C6C3AE3